MKDFLGEDGGRVDADHNLEKITIRQGSGASSFTQTRVANDGSKTKLEAKELFLAGKQAAEDTVQRQDVPAGYRQYLKRYYDSIQPADEQ
ncbi:MAG: hypothetical protein O2816_00745 [Planctomycetota bacterium]|nr:hypothetical protein [Planctomycetota bacterium]